MITKAIQKKKLFLKKLEFSQKLKISKICKISENFCLKHIKTVQNYLMSDKVCFFKHKNSKFLNNSCITENECVIAFLKSLCFSLSRNVCTDVPETPAQQKNSKNQKKTLNESF
jgi:hypothetical protein